MKAIDCFSGCGGLSEGLKKAGFTVLAGIEIRESARKAHKLNHPKTKLYEDITQVTPAQILSDLELKPGDLELLAGCPPCQGFSTIRTRNGADQVVDPRNELIFNFINLAIGLQPKTILIENVPALRKDWRLQQAKQVLLHAGYKWIDIGVLNAAHFEVPQRRKRMILMASRLGPISLPSPLVSAKSRTVRQTIGSLKAPRSSKKWLHKLYMRHSEEIKNRIRKIPKNGGSRMDLGIHEQLKCHKNIDGFKDVYGRMEWDAVAPTITRFSHNPSKGRFLHPVQNRALTIYEAMRLQSFPPTYKFPRNLCVGELASLIGEALPPKFAEAQALHIKKHLDHFPRKKK